MSAGEVFKARNFVPASIKNGQMAWITKTDLQEFGASSRCRPFRSAPPEYTSKRFAISLAGETPAGDIFIGGQNFAAHASLA